MSTLLSGATTSFRGATMDDWWRLSARYPEFRKQSHAMLKDFGYMALMELIEEQAPCRFLEFGHGFNSTLLAKFGAACEAHGVDDYQGLPYFPPKHEWEELYENWIRTPCPDAHLHRGLLGDGDIEGLAANSFDLLVSVSVLEELPPEVLERVVAHSYELLKPGGMFAGSFDVQLKHTDRVDPFVDAIRQAGFEMDRVETPNWESRFNELLIESPSTVMLTYQMAEGDDRVFNGHWSSLWFVIRKPEGAAS